MVENYTRIWLPGDRDGWNELHQLSQENKKKEGRKREGEEKKKKEEGKKEEENNNNNNNTTTERKIPIHMKDGLQGHRQTVRISEYD